MYLPGRTETTQRLRKTAPESPAIDLLSPVDNSSLVSPDDRLQGTLDLLILRTLNEGPLHGWAISRRIRERSDDVLQVNQGSLYPALHRLEDEGWLAAEWAVADTGRRAKVYQLTTLGRRALVREERGWLSFVGAVTQVLRPA